MPKLPRFSGNKRSSRTLSSGWTSFKQSAISTPSYIGKRFQDAGL
jgi:hypothetical protein